MTINGTNEQQDLKPPESINRIIRFLNDIKRQIGAGPESPAAASFAPGSMGQQSSSFAAGITGKIGIGPLAPNSLTGGTTGPGSSIAANLASKYQISGTDISEFTSWLSKWNNRQIAAPNAPESEIAHPPLDMSLASPQGLELEEQAPAAELGALPQVPSLPGSTIAPQQPPAAPDVLTRAWDAGRPPEQPQVLGQTTGLAPERPSINMPELIASITRKIWAFNLASGGLATGLMMAQANLAPASLAGGIGAGSGMPLYQLANALPGVAGAAGGFMPAGGMQFAGSVASSPFLQTPDLGFPVSRPAIPTVSLLGVASPEPPRQEMQFAQGSQSPFATAQAGQSGFVSPDWTSPNQPDSSQNRLGLSQTPQNLTWQDNPDTSTSPQSPRDSSQDQSSSNYDPKLASYDGNVTEPRNADQLLSSSPLPLAYPPQQTDDSLGFGPGSVSNLPSDSQSYANLLGQYRQLQGLYQAYPGLNAASAAASQNLLSSSLVNLPNQNLTNGLPLNSPGQYPSGVLPLANQQFPNGLSPTGTGNGFPGSFAPFQQQGYQTPQGQGAGFPGSFASFQQPEFQTSSLGQGSGILNSIAGNIGQGNLSSPPGQGGGILNAFAGNNGQGILGSPSGEGGGIPNAYAGNIGQGNLSSPPGKGGGILNAFAGNNGQGNLGSPSGQGGGIPNAYAGNIGQGNLSSPPGQGGGILNAFAGNNGQGNLGSPSGQGSGILNAVAGNIGQGNLGSPPGQGDGILKAFSGNIGQGNLGSPPGQGGGILNAFAGNIGQGNLGSPHGQGGGIPNQFAGNIGHGNLSSPPAKGGRNPNSFPGTVGQENLSSPPAPGGGVPNPFAGKIGQGSFIRQPSRGGFPGSFGGNRVQGNLVPPDGNGDVFPESHHQLQPLGNITKPIGQVSGLPGLPNQFQLKKEESTPASLHGFGARSDKAQFISPRWDSVSAGAGGYHEREPALGRPELHSPFSKAHPTALNLTWSNPAPITIPIGQTGVAAKSESNSERKATPEMGLITLLAPPLLVASADAEKHGAGISVNWPDLLPGARDLDEGGLASLRKVLPLGASAVYPAIPANALPANAINLRLAPTLLTRLLSQSYGTPTGRESAQILQAAAVKFPSPSSIHPLQASMVPLKPPIFGQPSLLAPENTSSLGALANAGALQSKRGGTLDFLGLPVRLAPTLSGRSELSSEIAARGGDGSLSTVNPVRPAAFAAMRNRLFPTFSSVTVEPDRAAWSKAAPAFGLRDSNPVTLLSPDARVRQISSAWPAPQLYGNPAGQNSAQTGSRSPHMSHSPFALPFEQSGLANQYQMHFPQFDTASGRSFADRIVGVQQVREPLLNSPGRFFLMDRSSTRDSNQLFGGAGTPSRSFQPNLPFSASNLSSRSTSGGGGSLWSGGTSGQYSPSGSTSAGRAKDLKQSSRVHPNQPPPWMPLPQAGIRPQRKPHAGPGEVITIQRATESSHPDMNGAKGPGDSPDKADNHKGSNQSSDVNVLASEVWGLLKRRIAVESERMGSR
jgi:hypothetical protein